MLEIDLPGGELFNNKTGEFWYPTPAKNVTMEHSLLSISKWESKWKIPFIGNKSITVPQFIDYVRCMTITKNISTDLYICLMNDIDTLKKITNYMEDSMTATTINEAALMAAGGKRMIMGRNITSELVYYWMASLSIPFECEKWHINRLLTLIKVASIESQPPKKMGKKEALSQQAALNASRKARLNTHG